MASRPRPTPIRTLRPRLAVVHNGIIENFKALREELAAKGYAFRDRDRFRDRRLRRRGRTRKGQAPDEAVQAALRRLRGAFALVYLFEGEEDLLIGARQGAPLAIGYGEGEMYLGSDALALAPFTDRVAYLEEGDWVALTREGAEIRDASGKVVKRRIQRSPAGSLLAEKGNYRHFMAKEIHEQPEVVGHTLAHYIDMAALRLKPFAWPVDPKAAQPRFDRRLRHRLYGRPRRQVLDRALRAAAGRDRRRLGIPLSRGAGRRRRA